MNTIQVDSRALTTQRKPLCRFGFGEHFTCCKTLTRVSNQWKKIAKKGQDYADDLTEKFNDFIEDVTEKFESVIKEAKVAKESVEKGPENASSGN